MSIRIKVNLLPFDAINPPEIAPNVATIGIRLVSHLISVHSLSYDTFALGSSKQSNIF